MQFNHSIFEQVSKNEFPIADYYAQTYNKPANITNVHEVKVDTDVLSILEKLGSEVQLVHISKVVDVLSDSTTYIHRVCIHSVYVKWRKVEKTRGLHNLTNSTTELQETKSVTIYHPSHEDAINYVNSLVSLLKLEQAIPDHTGKCYLIIKNSYGELDLKEFKVNVDEVDMELNYGAEFAHKIDCLVAKVNSKKMNGVSLFHGPPGTGKTSAVRLLTKRFNNRKVIFVPPFLTDAITSPDFLPFLLENPGSVLVLEDAEKVLMSRDHNPSSGQGVSSILNLTDGLLADALNMHIIATFNADRTTIDKALLREGRLCVEHKFDKLSVEQSNRLLAHLNPTANNTTTKPLTLAEIYTFGEEKLNSQPQSQSIGFTR